jgi:hypothetical protein
MVDSKKIPATGKEITSKQNCLDDNKNTEAIIVTLVTVLK